MCLVYDSFTPLRHPEDIFMTKALLYTNLILEIESRHGDEFGGKWNWDTMAVLSEEKQGFFYIRYCMDALILDAYNT